MGAEFLVKNEGEYSGFIEGDFQAYVTGVQNGSLWGGELEIIIICRLLNITVKVIKWDGRSGCSVNPYPAPLEGAIINQATITYHRFLMQSEHYNGTALI